MLDVSSNNLTADAAVNISLALHSLPHVQRLLLQDSCICGNAEDLGHALCRLPSLRHVDLTNDEMSLADCCLIFALMLSSQAPVTTLLLPFNLFSEFPALLSRNRISRDGQHTSTCWCDCNSTAQAARC